MHTGDIRNDGDVLLFYYLPFPDFLNVAICVMLL